MDEKEFEKQFLNLVTKARTFDDCVQNIYSLAREIENTKGAIKKKEVVHKLFECVPKREVL